MEPISLLDGNGILLVDIYRKSSFSGYWEDDHPLSLLYGTSKIEKSIRNHFDVLINEFRDVKVTSEIVGVISVDLYASSTVVFALEWKDVLDCPESVNYYKLPKGSLIPPEIAIYIDDHDKKAKVYFASGNQDQQIAAPIAQLCWIPYGIKPHHFSLNRPSSLEKSPNDRHFEYQSHKRKATNEDKDATEEEEEEEVGDSFSSSSSSLVTKEDRTWKEYLALMAVGMVPIGGPALCAVRNFQQQRYIDASIDTGFVFFDILTWGGSSLAKFSIKGMVEAFSKSALKETSKESVEMGARSLLSSVLSPKLFSLEAVEIVLNTTMRLAVTETSQETTKGLMKEMSKELARESSKRVLTKCATEYVIRESMERLVPDSLLSK